MTKSFSWSKMNATIDSLNQEYALEKHLFFKQLPSGIVVAQIDTPLATATVSLYGGQPAFVQLSKENPSAI